MPKLGALIRHLDAGQPRMWRNVQVVTLFSREPIAPPVDYVLSEQAMRRGLLRVTEVDDAGQVGTVLAENRGDLPVLLLDGEELRGAKQNRIINCDVLLRPRGKARVPVSCVERGRWRYARSDFVPGSYGSAGLRARKSRAVERNLEAHGAPQADQGEVWDYVDMMLDAARVTSASDAMADIADRHSATTETLAKAVPWTTDAIGVLVYIDGSFCGLDVFDRPDVLRDLWSRLLGGYALDAVARPQSDSGRVEPMVVDRFLTRLAECECRLFESVDMGEDWRVVDAEYTGSALVVGRQALHLSVFPKPPAGDELKSGRMARPSARGRSAMRVDREMSARRREAEAGPCSTQGVERQGDTGEVRTSDQGGNRRAGESSPG